MRQRKNKGRSSDDDLDEDRHTRARDGDDGEFDKPKGWNEETTIMQGAYPIVPASPAPHTPRQTPSSHRAQPPLQCTEQSFRSTFSSHLLSKPAASRNMSFSLLSRHKLSDGPCRPAEEAQAGQGDDMRTDRGSARSAAGFTFTAPRKPSHTSTASS